MENLIAVLQYLEDGNEHLFTETANECGLILSGIAAAASIVIPFITLFLSQYLSNLN